MTRIAFPSLLLTSNAAGRHYIRITDDSWIGLFRGAFGVIVGQQFPCPVVLLAAFVDLNSDKSRDAQKNDAKNQALHRLEGNSSSRMLWRKIIKPSRK